MFESTGGGVGVLDFDHDGWPDLFFAQGTLWPVDGKDTAHGDRLLRNRGSLVKPQEQRFVDVTTASGICESAFGQGVAVGDINNDGFDDLYVANVGRNQWWINQGDGTWRDGNTFLDSPDEAWTVSAFIADLNADGQAEFPGLFAHVEEPILTESLLPLCLQIVEVFRDASLANAFR